MSYASDALIDALERQVKKTKAENAKLRSQYTDLVDERERLFQANVEKNGEVLRLVNENAKLRMFIDLKETCWKYVGWCDECPYNGADDAHNDFNCTVQEKINLLAYKLGIKVNE